MTNHGTSSQIGVPPVVAPPSTCRPPLVFPVAPQYIVSWPAEDLKRRHAWVAGWPSREG